MNIAKPDRKLNIKRSLYGVIVIASILFAGSFFRNGVVSKGEIIERNNMLSAIKTAASGIDPVLVRSLKGVPDELGKENHSSLLTVLKRIKSANEGIRFVYIIAKRADEIVFLVDAESTTSDDYSPPGQVYSDIPDEFVKVFASSQPDVVGPVTDRWGTWVTGLSPIIDHKSNELVAVIAMDVDAGIWEDNINTYSWFALIIIGLFGFVVLVFSAGMIHLKTSNTELQNREDRLIHQNAEISKLSIATEQSPTTIVITDIDGNIEFVNQRFTEVTGYSKEEAIGKNSRVFNSDYHTEEFYKGLWDTILSGKIWHGEFRNIKKNKDLFWESASISPIKNDAGIITNFIAIKEDITKNKETELQLSESENKANAILEFAPDGMVIINDSAEIIKVNGQIEKILGYKRGELVGQKIEILVPENIREKHVGLRDSFISNPGLLTRGAQLELTAQCKDGKLLPVDVGLSAIELGEKTIIMASMRDITERKEAEEALRKSENHVKTILSTANEGFWFINNERITIDVNPSMCDILGRDREEIIGKSIFDFVDAENQSVFIAQAKILRKGISSTYEISLLRTDGTLVPCLFNETSFINEDNKLSGSFALISNITERKEKENVSTLTAEIGETLIRTLTLREKLQQCSEALVNNLGAAFVRIWTVDADEKLLHLQASAGLYTHIDGKRQSVQIGKKKIGKIAETKKPYINANVVDDPLLDEKQWAIDNGLVGFCGYPMLVEGKIIGVIAMFFKTELNSYFLESSPAIATSIAVAIMRDMAEENLKDRMNELERFGQLTINREEKMIQLKEEINTLRGQLGKENKYKIVE